MTHQNSNIITIFNQSSGLDCSNGFFKNTADIDSMIAAATAAGKEVLRIYLDDNFEVEIKSDNSPLTC